MTPARPRSVLRFVSAWSAIAFSRGLPRRSASSSTSSAAAFSEATRAWKTRSSISWSYRTGWASGLRFLPRSPQKLKRPHVRALRHPRIAQKVPPAHVNVEQGREVQAAIHQGRIVAKLIRGHRAEQVRVADGHTPGWRHLARVEGGAGV